MHGIIEQTLKPSFHIVSWDSRDTRRAGWRNEDRPNKGSHRCKLSHIDHNNHKQPVQLPQCTPMANNHPRLSSIRASYVLKISHRHPLSFIRTRRSTPFSAIIPPCHSIYVNDTQYFRHLYPLRRESALAICPHSSEQIDGHNPTHHLILNSTYIIKPHE